MFSRPLGDVIDTSPRPRQTRATCPVVAKQWSTGGRRSSLPLGGWALSSRDVAGNTKGFKLACELLYNSQLAASRNCRRQRLQSLMKSPATLGCIVCATIILHPALAVRVCPPSTQRASQLLVSRARLIPFRYRLWARRAGTLREPGAPPRGQFRRRRGHNGPYSPHRNTNIGCGNCGLLASCKPTL